MKKRLLAFIIYTLFWLFFFVIARGIFLVMQFRELITYSPVTILGSFTHGFKLDLSATCYVLAIPLLVALPGLYFSGRWYKIFLKAYSFLLIIIFSALVIGDGMTYKYWGFRMGFFIMEYLKTPGDAAASGSNLQIIGMSIALILMSVLFIYICNRLINKFFSSFTRVKFILPSVIFMLLLIPSLIIPIRGGFGVATLNQGSVYFSQSLFPNHAAINVIWNFGNTAIYRKPTSNPYIFYDENEARKDVSKLLEDKGQKVNYLNTLRPNVIIMIVESFGSMMTDMGTGDSVVAPRFRELVPEGIYFTNIYCAGSRTDKAIPAILAGYPNIPTLQVIREPGKTQSMSGIAKLFDSLGYKTSFWYGGDINFANINSFITTTGFGEKITMDNFSSKDYNSKWGVHDGVLLTRLSDSLSHVKQPFAYGLLTLSSHEPFEVPMKTVFAGSDGINLFKNSIYYTDKCIGEFIDRAKKSEWWNNTLIILIADHSRRMSEKVPVFSREIFKIPMLWLGGALEQRNIKINKFGNQFDLPLTLANQLNLKSSFPFSKDLLSTGSNSFTFYTYNEGFAFLTDSSTAIYDIKLKDDVVREGKNPGSAEKLGKSFLQVLFNDYLHR